MGEQMLDGTLSKNSLDGHHQHGGKRGILYVAVHNSQAGDALQRHYPDIVQKSQGKVESDHVIGQQIDQLPGSSFPGRNVIQSQQLNKPTTFKYHFFSGYLGILQVKCAPQTSNRILESFLFKNGPRLNESKYKLVIISILRRFLTVKVAKIP